GPAAKSGRVEGSARLDPGSVRFAGALDGGTLATRLHLTAGGLPLAPLRGYVDAGLRRVSARGGAVDAGLDVAFTPPAAGGPGSLELRGTVEGRQLALALPDAAEPFLRVDRLGAELAPVRLLPAIAADLARVRVAGAVLQVRRAGAGTLSLAPLWATAAPTSGETAPAPVAGPPAVRLGQVQLAGGRIEFTDQAVQPRVRVTLRELEADLRRAGADAARMALRLRAMLGAGSPV